MSKAMEKVLVRNSDSFLVERVNKNLKIKYHKLTGYVGRDINYTHEKYGFTLSPEKVFDGGVRGDKSFAGFDSAVNFLCDSLVDTHTVLNTVSEIDKFYNSLPFKDD